MHSWTLAVISWDDAINYFLRSLEHVHGHSRVEIRNDRFARALEFQACFGNVIELHDELIYHNVDLATQANNEVVCRQRTKHVRGFWLCNIRGQAQAKILDV